MFTTLILWIGGYGIFLNHITTLQPEHPQKQTDAIVVLTGGNHRIATGLELFASKNAPYLFITGVNKSTTKQNILSVHKGKPLPECCVELGYDATTTYENAFETKAWLAGKNINNIRLVTSPYHMPRTSLEFSHVLGGIEIIKHPVEKPDHSPKKVTFWRITFDEYNKTLYRYLRLKMPE